MGYVRTFWRDFVLSVQNRFSLTKVGADLYDITPYGEVMQEGTPLNAEHFNNMEEGIIDAHLAANLIINALRQLPAEPEYGSLEITSTPQTVAFKSAKNLGSYIVLAEVNSVTGDGNVEDVVITDKLTNGFKIAFTGSATKAAVTFIVIGG